MSLSEKSRRLLKMVCRGVGVSAIAFSLNGCMYGPPPDRPEYGPGPDYMSDVCITGVIHDQNTYASIPGIKVSVQGQDAHAFSYGSGYFSVFVPVQETYQLKFEDVDGPANGVYQPKEMTVVLADARSGLGTIHLNPEE